MAKLSIIVPVYNVAPYLRKCVDSLLAQDYEDYEIILVDDGSIDDCPQICDEYASTSFASSHQSNIPIRVIHQPNGGLSAARNSGIKVAQGEYVCFVDSDDYWQPNVLGTLIEQVEDEQLDVLRFDYRNVRVVDAEHLDAARLESASLDATQLEYEIFEPNKHPHRADSQGDVVTGIDYLNRRMGYACYAWQFIIRRNLIYNSQSTIHNLQSTIDNLLFTEGIHFEDVDWLPRMMLQAQQVNSTTLVVYNYLAREGSITQAQGNKDKQRKNIEDFMRIIEQYNTYLAHYPNCAWLKNMQSIMVSGVLTTVARDFYLERKEYLSRLKALHVFPLAITDQGHTYIRKAKLINALSPQVYCWIMNILKTVK